MMRRIFSTRAGAVLTATAVLTVLAGTLVAVWKPIARRADSGKAQTNAERFASLAFGEGGPGLLEATSSQELHPFIATQYRMPNGWLLRPAGAQVDTARAPTGLAVSPNNDAVYVVSSGVFDEQLVVVDPVTLAKTQQLVGDLYMGAAADASGNLWVSGGSRNRVFQFRSVSAAAVPVRSEQPVPGGGSNGIPVVGYPGNMVLGPNGRLYVVGNISVPEAEMDRLEPLVAHECPNGGPNSNPDKPICSAINVINVSNPLAPSPAVHLVPVGRDAFGIALSQIGPKTLLYVSNWADETNPNPARSAGRGTVSVVDVTTPGSEAEVQVVPVGRHPTGLAISPDGTRVAVANSADDTVSVLAVGSDGLVPVGGVQTVSVKTVAGARIGATPLAVSFTPDAKNILVGLAGQNAIEVLDASGPVVAAIERDVTLFGGTKIGTTLHVPHTYIPTAWYPSAMTTFAHPNDPSSFRLYVTNLKGIGSGPGFYAQAAPVSGFRTQGTLSVIDVPKQAGDLSARLDQWTATVVENNRWATLFNGSSDAASDPCLPATLPDGSTTKSKLLCDAHSGALTSDVLKSLHVVYIVKENKTFDQFFGDLKPTLPDAEADPTWLLYGEAVTTNQHNLARTYTISDNFWADSEQSTTGHNWTSAGYTTEHSEITWNPDYSLDLRGSRRSGAYRGQGLEGQSRPDDPLTRDPDVAEAESELFDPEERLVDIFADSIRNPLGLTYRVYSGDVNDDSAALAHQFPLGLWGLGGGANTPHAGGDLEFPDTDRANIFIRGETVSNAWTIFGGPPKASFGTSIGLCGDPTEGDGAYCAAKNYYPTPKNTDRDDYVLAEWTENFNDCIKTNPDAVCQRVMPNFTYMALPVDHTLGFNPLSPTPASMVADNDYAVGLIVDALSRSPFWKNTLILITEDDTQFAGDHIDTHRTFLLSAGGLARQLGAAGKASHQAGSFPSILKTIEVLFRLPNITIYDRESVPLHDVVVDCLAPGNGCDDVANSTAYTAVRPPTPFLRNPDDGNQLARISQMMDWTIDMTDPEVMRDLFYAGIRGWPLPDSTKALLKPKR